MIKKRRTVADSDAARHLVYQVIMAFGQGAGSTTATGASLDALIKPYIRKFEIALDRKVPAMAILNIARAAGTVAAAHAARAGRCVIDVQDVAFGLRAVRRTSLEPLAPCPLTYLQV